jgi:hypothetical protein
MGKNNKLLIKGMVCNRCIAVLSEELAKLGLDISSINLGEVILKENRKDRVDDQSLIVVLQKNGFDLLYDKNEQLISQIKAAVERGIHEQAETGNTVKFSKLISDEFHKDYDSLSAIFSFTQGITLEKYIILKKIEKVKELSAKLNACPRRPLWANTNYRRRQITCDLTTTPGHVLPLWDFS